MNAQEILTLVNAGFTKADILALANPDDKPAEIPAEPEEQAAKDAPIEKSENEAPAMPAEVSAVLNQINATLAKLQAYAVKTDAQPMGKTADYKDILGSVYNGQKRE